MKILSAVFIFLIITSSSCKDTAEAQTGITNAFPNLTFDSPVDIQNAGDGSGRLFVLSQSGIIHVFNNNPAVASSQVFLDITNKVYSGGERGLLGLAFHPDFKSSGYFYVYYSTRNPGHVSRISRFQVDQNNPNRADPNSEYIILEQEQPYSNHNGGQIVFGPDNYLYISFGDGGAGGDPENRAQNRTTLLGKILRIDVDHPGNGLNYSIPADNPYFGNSNGFRQEIFAYGLRNVWRFSFDTFNNLIWAADVGQNEWEEIDIIKKGGNYGWRIMEGYHCYDPATGCDTIGLTLPIHEYGHDNSGGYSVTGGYVYMGSSAPDLTNKYIYGDFGSGRVWAISYNGTDAVNELVAETNKAISTFGIDENKELYFASYSEGKIYKFTGTR